MSCKISAFDSWCTSMFTCDIRNGLTNPGTRQEITQELISKIEYVMYYGGLKIVLLITLISVQLNGWKEGLAPEVDITSSSRATALPHRIMLHAAYWWLFILLHRPFYRRARVAHNGEKDIDHVKVRFNSQGAQWHT